MCGLRCPPTLTLAPEKPDTDPFRNSNRAFTHPTHSFSIIHSFGNLVCDWPSTHLEASTTNPTSNLKELPTWYERQTQSHRKTCEGKVL